MTVAELMKELETRHPSDVVCIDTRGFARGIFPIGDTIRNAQIEMLRENYFTVVLHADKWP